MPSLPVPDRSSTGLDPKLAGLLCYFGIFVTGILFLILEKNSRFVKFHAMQSIVVSSTFIVIQLVLGAVPVIGWLIGLVIVPAAFVLWIALMLLTLQGRRYKVPVLGDIAEQIASHY
ncbi:membrane protein [Paenibacillus cisolokensis]|uniref:Membrane protein n=1 Tax=Paenibacillus cisolokensis TaxID=1658519 RepID=A0ABQ4N722_9BACL|nr:DUF4870 domain-containing protein [Paenibacillus cisolokensis]GIQ63957.1 membrane protein [Paenibacillus cisolokensis]